MKKFFNRTGGDKPKLTKPPPNAREPDVSGRSIEDPSHVPIYQQFHTPGSGGSPVHPRPVQRSASSGLDSLDRASEDRWEVVAAQDQRTPEEFADPPRAPALTNTHSSSGGHPPRPESPYSTASSHNVPYSQPQTQMQTPNPQRKGKKPQPTSAVAALGILNALNPQATAGAQGSPPGVPQQQMWVDDNGSEINVRYPEERREKKPSSWWSDRSKDRDKGKARDVNDPADLVRMIGYLVATHAEDWSFVLEVCERTNLNDNNSKEAAKALRKEFKYSEPSAQLSAAKLWAIMLNNCNEYFALQCGSRKFLDAIEEVITSSQTSPVVRDRLLEVLAGATFASIQRRQDGKKHEKDGFQSLWRKVKPPGKPDSGVPFDTEDAMFNPPTPRRMSAYAVPAPAHAPLEPLRSPAHAEMTDSRPGTADGQFPRQGQGQLPHRPKNGHHGSKNRVIPLEEDIRRLFQECKVGRGNASLLSQSLTYAKPQDLRKDIIEEFYIKCQASQEFIATQIPWATAQADRSREARIKQISMLTETEQQAHLDELTVQEQLLADLLGANEELLDSLRMYDDIQRIGLERQAEIISRQDTRMPRSQIPFVDTNGSSTSYDASVSGSYQSSGSHLALPASNGTEGSSRSSSPPSPSSSPAASAPSLTHHSHSGSIQGIGHGPLPRPPAHSQAQGLPSTPPMTHAIPPSLMAGSLAPPTRFGPRSPAQVSLNRSRTPSPERAGLVYANTNANMGMVAPAPSPGAVSGKAPLPAPPGPPGPPGPPHPAFAQAKRAHSGSVDSAAGALRRLEISREQRSARRSMEDEEALTPVKPSAKALGKRRAVPVSPSSDRFDPDDLFHDRSDHSDNEWRNEDDEDDHRSGMPTARPVQYAYDAVAERHEQLVREGKLALLADLAEPTSNGVR